MKELQSPLSANSSLESLLGAPQAREEQLLAARYAPLIAFDESEPFLPLAAGYTVFRRDALSPSFPRQVRLSEPGLPASALAIEYAVWWDWDIGHLYELEHVWVFVDEAGTVVRCEASWHGGYNDMAIDGAVPSEGDHPLVFSEPGKHAFAPDPEWFISRRTARAVKDQTMRQAGGGGVWITPLFESDLRRLRTPFACTLARSYLQQHTFQPTHRFAQRILLSEDMLVPWPVLASWIPTRVRGTIDRMAVEMPRDELHFMRIAHRGASAYAPENTLAAFRKAAELDANGVELDVQLSADGVAVVIHDLVATRLGDPRAVSEIPFDDLRRLDAGEGERIPTLDEALECCAEEWLIPYIEIKAGAALPAVVDAIAERRLHRHALVGSFRADWIAAVKALDKDIETSILFGVPNIDPVRLAQAVGADYVHPCWESVVDQPHRLLTAEWLQSVRAAGLGIVLWHEERPAEIAHLRRMGVDAICSDAPDLLA